MQQAIAEEMSGKVGNQRDYTVLRFQRLLTKLEEQCPFRASFFRGSLCAAGLVGQPLRQQSHLNIMHSVVVGRMVNSDEDLAWRRVVGSMMRERSELLIFRDNTLGGLLDNSEVKKHIERDIENILGE